MNGMSEVQRTLATCLVCAAVLMFFGVVGLTLDSSPEAPEFSEDQISQAVEVYLESVEQAIKTHCSPDLITEKSKEVIEYETYWLQARLQF